MATYFRFNIGLHNVLLPDGSKPLPKAIFTLYCVSEVLWYSHESNFIESAQAIILYYEFGNKFLQNLPRANELRIDKSWHTHLMHTES